MQAGKVVSSYVPGRGYAALEEVAEKLAEAGYQTGWDRSIPYVQRLIVTDPAGTQIALIGA